MPARTRYPLLFEHEDLEFLANRFTEVALEPSRDAGTDFEHALALIPGTVLVSALPGPCTRVSTRVETLGRCTVEVWGRQDGGIAKLGTRTLSGRNAGTLEFDADGIEWLVYRAETSEDCGRWTWELPTPDLARAARPGHRGTPGPGGPWPPDLPDLPGPGGPGVPGTPGHPDPETPEGGEGAVVPDDANLPRPVTTVPCCTLLYQVCWLQESVIEAADQLKERREAFKEWTDEWSGSARVFGPNTVYRLTATVEAAGIDDPATLTRTVFFRTQGPPGFLAEDPDGKGGLLARLPLYTERTSPPEGAGLRLDAPPHYRKHDVAVLYNRDHVKEMYAGKLFLQLVDANGAPVAGPDGTTLFEADFTDPANRVLTTGETVFIEAIDGADCSSITAETVSPGDSQGFDLPLLAPATLYQARILGGWSEKLGLDTAGEVVVVDPNSVELAEVLRWEFVTSRYDNFGDHVGSYDKGAGPWDGRDAITGAGGALDEAAVAALVAAAQAGPPAWDEDEKAAADELLALLGVAPRVPPERLDVTVVRDSPRAVGLLLDSPEPLDWARVTVAAEDGDTGAAVPVTLVRARDGRRALLFRRSNGSTLRTLDAGELAFAMTYDLAVAPARYAGGASGTETATLTVTIAEVGP